MDSYGRTLKPHLNPVEVEFLEIDNHFDIEDMLKEGKNQSKKQTNDSENNRVNSSNRDKYGRLFNSTNSAISSSNSASNNQLNKMYFTNHLTEFEPDDLSFPDEIRSEQPKYDAVNIEERSLNPTKTFDDENFGTQQGQGHSLARLMNEFKSKRKGSSKNGFSIF